MKRIETTKQAGKQSRLLAKHDTNVAKHDRKRRIVKLKADLANLNAYKPNSSNSMIGPNVSTADVQAIKSLKGVNFNSIEEHYLYTRSKNRCSSDPFCNQPIINRMMRAVLFNWLLEVTNKLRLKPRTIFLTANIFDRYLVSNPVDKQSLQLLGITCLYVASKFEDIHPPKVNDLCSLCDNIYTSEQVVKLEGRILSVLKFNLIFVSALDIVELKLARAFSNDKAVERFVLFVLHAFMLQGTCTMVDGFKLAGFVCALVQRCFPCVPVDVSDIDQKEATKLEQCLKQMISVANKHKLGALTKAIDDIGSAFVL